MRQIFQNAAGFRARRFFIPLRLFAGARTCGALARQPARKGAASLRSGTIGLFFFFLTCPLRAAETSEPAPLAARTLLLDVSRAGDKLIAVGDHGNVVISVDEGRTWTQSLVPTRVLLTGVSFPDAQHGWAVGHDGVILATSDGGLTWQRQDDGKQSDTILLDVLFLDATHGFAVGAYGCFRATTDGGRTWTAGKPSPDEIHFNRITAGSDGYLYLAGESGTLLVSTDGGQVWVKAEVPYAGSLFGALPLENGRVVLYGLRGHILRADGHAAAWQPVANETKVLIMAGLRLANGTVVLGGQGGNFFLSHDAGRTFQIWKPAGFGTGVAALAEAAGGWLVTVGEAGAVRVKLP